MEGTELRRYYENGTLRIDCKKWSDTDRLTAGERLQKIFFDAGFYLRSIDPTKIRVDISGYKATPESRLIAENLFRKAIRKVPREFMSMVNLVVLEDKKISSKDRELIYNAKWCLCKGLDYLCDHFSSSHSQT